MINWAELLQQKYRIMQQQADQAGMVGRAAANLDNIRAGLLPRSTSAEIAQTEAQTRNLGLTGDMIKPLAEAQIRAADSGIALNRANIGRIGEEIQVSQTGRSMLNGGITSAFDRVPFWRFGMQEQRRGFWPGDRN